MGTGGAGSMACFRSAVAPVLRASRSYSNATITRAVPNGLAMVDRASRGNPRQMAGFMERFRGKRENKEFQKTVDDLASRDVYDLDAFLFSLEDSTKMMGIKGLKTKMPGSGDQATEIDKYVRILTAFPPVLRADPDATGPGHKKRIAQIAEVEVSDVNQILVRYEHSKVMWTLIKSLQDAGEQLPTTAEEAQDMMGRSPIARTAAMARNQQQMRKKAKRNRGKLKRAGMQK